LQTDSALFSLDKQVKTITDASKLAKDKYNAGKDIADQGTGGNWTDADPILDEAEEARQKAMEGMNDLVSMATTNLLNAPSADSARATEEMVSSTMVTAYQDIVSGFSRAYEDFGKSKEITAGLSNSAEAQKLLDGWSGTLNNLVTSQQATNDLMGKIDSFSKTPEVAAAQAESKLVLQGVVDMVKKAIEDAKAKLEELKAKEKAEAEAAANGNSGDGTL